MSLLRDSIPASFRKPKEGSRFVQEFVVRAPQSALLAGVEARAASLTKSRFAPLPQEPEDARITGVTRSLNRRLLALNLPGSLRIRTAMKVA